MGKIEYRMTPKGTLYPKEETIRMFPALEDEKYWEGLTSVFVEDDDKFQELQEKLWMIYADLDDARPVFSPKIDKQQKILNDSNRFNFNAIVDHYVNSDVPSCDILGWNDI